MTLDLPFATGRVNLLETRGVGKTCANKLVGVTRRLDNPKRKVAFYLDYPYFKYHRHIPDVTAVSLPIRVRIKPPTSAVTFERVSLFPFGRARVALVDNASGDATTFCPGSFPPDREPTAVLNRDADLRQYKTPINAPMLTDTLYPVSVIRQCPPRPRSRGVQNYAFIVIAEILQGLDAECATDPLPAVVAAHLFHVLFGPDGSLGSSGDSEGGGGGFTMLVVDGGLCVGKG
ncbi:hypothetical protein ANO14919_053540 [Xylariales sp. No.14919]|nr:hypothetical protein ANO14919_053540 [Xylariales sp. No.14919]